MRLHILKAQQLKILTKSKYLLTAEVNGWGKKFIKVKSVRALFDSSWKAKNIVES